MKYFSVAAALIAAASAVQVEVTVFSHCSTDFYGFIYDFSTSTAGASTTIPAGGQATFLLPGDTENDLWVSATAGGSYLIDLAATDNGSGSETVAGVNAPSLAPGVVLTPSGTLGGTCNIVDLGTSYQSNGQATDQCPTGTFYALDICSS